MQHIWLLYKIYFTRFAVDLEQEINTSLLRKQDFLSHSNLHIVLSYILTFLVNGGSPYWHGVGFILYVTIWRTFQAIWINIDRCPIFWLGVWYLYCWVYIVAWKFFVNLKPKKLAFMHGPIFQFQARLRFQCFSSSMCMFHHGNNVCWVLN